MFVVQEHFAAETPRVAVAVDQRPAMSLYAPPFPWLDKAAAVDVVTDLIAGAPSCADRRARGALGTSPDLGAALRALALRRARLPTGSFVFVVSDFLGDLDPRHWVRLRARAWDVTPVVVQDPTWEQSFPPVGGIAIPFVAADGGDVRETWLRDGRRRAAGRRTRGGSGRCSAGSAARARPRGDRQLGSRTRARRLPRLGGAAAATPTARDMTRTVLVAYGRVRRSRPVARRPEQLPRHRGEAPRTVGFADAFDYVVEATVAVLRRGDRPS